jgi:glycosyltransferase involved in cell wall biosynthesis
MSLPAVSIVIPVYNGADILGRCLEAASRQDYPGAFEIVVVDNASTDGSGAIAASFESTRVVGCRRRGPAAARNAGARAARFDLIAFTDADCSPEQGWLRGLVAGLGADDAGVGGDLVAASQGLVQDVVSEISFNQAASAASPLPYLATANLLVRRTDFEAVGGFDEAFPVAGGEDNDFCWRLARAGRRLRHVPGATCRHDHPRKVVDFLAQRFRYGWGERLLVQKHRSDSEVGAIVQEVAGTSWANICSLASRGLLGIGPHGRRHALVIALGEVAFFCGGTLAPAWAFDLASAKTRSGETRNRATLAAGEDQ